MLKKHTLLFAPDSAPGAAPAAPLIGETSPDLAAAPNQPPISSGFFADLEKLQPDPDPGKEPEAKPALDPKAAPVKADPKPAAVPDPKAGKKDGINELRAANEAKAAELKSEREARQGLEKKIADYEARGKDTEALAKELASVKKERDDRISELRRAKREASDGFKSNYQAPFDQAAANAEALVKTLEVIEKDADGNHITRPATFQDLNELYRMSRGPAMKMAFKMFGPEIGPHMVSTLSNLWRLGDAKDAALKIEMANYDAQEQAEQAQQATIRTARNTMWETVNKDIAGREPNWFSPDSQTDPAEKSLLSKGFETVDALNNGMTEQDRVMLNAEIRNRAAAFPMAKLRIQKLEAMLKERDATIEGMKGSKPGGGNGGGTQAAPAKEKGFLESFDGAMASRG